MNRRETSLAEANAAAIAQRARLRERLDATTTRLKPARLRSDAEREVERRVSQGAHLAVDQLKAHPIVSSLGVAALLAWVFREPLVELGPPKLRAAHDWLTAQLGFRHKESSHDANEEPAANPPPHSPPPGEDDD